MTLPRLYALNEYWLEHPPIHLTMAAYVGVKPKGKTKISKKDFDNMVAVFGSGPGRMITKEQMLKE